jgi:hypothetical protein
MTAPTEKICGDVHARTGYVCDVPVRADGTHNGCCEAVKGQCPTTGKVTCFRWWKA